MNRRSFFQSLSGAVVGVYMALHVKLPAVELVDEAPVSVLSVWSEQDRDLYNRLPNYLATTQMAKFTAGYESSWNRMLRPQIWPKG